MKKFFVFPLSLVVAAAACGKSGTPDAAGPAASAEPPAAETPETPAAETPEPDEKAEETTDSSEKPVEKKDLTGCEKHFAEFDKLLSTATYSCKKDTDCGCFDVQVSRTPGSECGGVVEKTLSKKLEAISKAAKKESCATSAMCEAWTCDPVCDSGQCRKTPKKK
jgi:hypothetical protein